MQRASIKIGISACLAGDKVRFDSGHKKSNFCMDELGKHVEYKRFCPEVAVGLPIPRPTIRQVRVGDTIKVCRPDGSGDVGPQLTEYGKKVATEQTAELSGFIFCAKSPSCGMERIKIYNEAGTGNTSEGIGFFAEQIMAHNPLLPCEENGRLNDMHLRENFVMRVYTYKHWQTLCEQPLTVHRLTQFHSQYKYLLMAHNYEAYRSLGNLLGTYVGEQIDTLAQQYITGLMNALKKPASRKNNSNTLMHLQGYFKKQLSKIEKQEFRDAIDEYREGLLPLYVPLTLVKHHLKVHPNEYLEKQVFLDPYPHELKLRYGI
ncbi:YbgA family protein [Pseudoalteromonas mariniglutinosa]|uniref:YbgA family protein n=1 Tax=Pseudoalteromonas mariniglutinosa TaxID=206042 RepID=UPI00384EF071